MGYSCMELFDCKVNRDNSTTVSNRGLFCHVHLEKLLIKKEHADSYLRLESTVKVDLLYYICVVLS